MELKLIQRGAESKVYISTLFGRKIIIKRREEKKYREKKLDKNLRKARTVEEARVLIKANKNNIPVPLVYYIDQHKKFDLWMEYIHGELLRDVEIKNKKMKNKKPGDFEHNFEHYNLYKKIGECLAKLHNTDIIHGDFTLANIMINNKMIDSKGNNKNNKLWIIDFGLSSFSNEIEEQAIDIILMQKSISSIVKEEKESQKKMDAFVEGYKNNKNWKAILERIDSIRKRGRYQIRKNS